MGCYSSKYEEYTYKNTLPIEYDFTEGKIVKVYDGDTFWIVAKWRGEINRFPIRLYGCDCWEMRGGDEETKAKAILARDYVRELILNKIVKVEIIQKREKYGRILANIFVGDVSLSQLLIRNGHAKPYYGTGEKIQ